MIVAEKSLEGVPALDAWGLHAEVQAIAAAYRYAGVDTSFEEVMGLTGAAFRTHCFRILDNPGLPLGKPEGGRADALWAPRWTWSSLYHNNYGHLEAARYYFGGEVTELDKLDVLELGKLVRFEVDAGRPVAAFGALEPHRGAFIVGYRIEKDPLRQLLLLQTEAGIVELELPPPAPLPVLGLPFGSPVPPWGYLSRTRRPAMPMEKLLLVRPGDKEAYRGTDEARRADVLRWSRSHAHGRKELIYETSRFYAVGLRGMEQWAAFLRDEVADELAHPTAEGDDPTAELALHTAVTALEWARARRAAAAWVATIPEGSPEAAAAFEASAAKLHQAFEVIGLEPVVALAALRSPELRGHIADLVLQARDLDAEAWNHLP